MGGGGREGLGGLEGLTPPFAINGESLPFANLSLDAAVSQLSRPFVLFLYRKKKAKSILMSLCKDVLVNSKTINT